MAIKTETKTEAKTEAVGKVLLDYQSYGGEDLYSDGEIEDTLLELAQKYEEEELNRVIGEQYSWPVLYHFSHIRSNIIAWLPIDKSQSVLEIGAGCGAITGKLAELAGRVDCIELSQKRSLINANRNRSHDNIRILVGNYTDIEKTLTEQYDVITLIGVFEYAESYMDSENPYFDFLESVKKHLKTGGQLIIAIENRLGMKYIAGCKEDHVGMIGEGLNGYPNTKGVRTFDKQELSQIMEKAGLSDFTFYYPYPDYKFPLRIYSDDYLPLEGELNTNYNNPDQARVETFSETKMFDYMIKNGLFPQFSNSYLLVIRGE